MPLYSTDFTGTRFTFEGWRILLTKASQRCSGDERAGLAANAHRDGDQQTMDARAYGVAHALSPLIVNTVV